MQCLSIEREINLSHTSPVLHTLKPFFPSWLTICEFERVMCKIKKKNPDMCFYVLAEEIAVLISYTLKRIAWAKNSQLLANTGQHTVHTTIG